MWRRRLAIVLGTAAGVIALSVALVPGLLARRLLAPRLSQALGTRIRVGWASWNPFSGTWTVRSVRVAADRGRPALSASRIAARVYLTDVLRRRLHVRDLCVDGARFRLRASGAGWELPLPARPGSPADGASAPRSPVVLDSGRARKTTLRLEPRGGRTSLLRLRRFEVGGALSASGVIGASLRLRGRLDRAPVVLGASLRYGESGERVRAELSATRVDLGRTLRLAPVGMAARQVGGILDLRGAYDARRHGLRAERRLSGNLRGDDLAAGESNRPGLRVRSLELERFDADLQSSSVSLGKLVLREPEVWVTRDAEGVAVPGVFKPEGPAAPAEGGAPSWHVTGTGGEIDGGALRYVDARADERTLVLRIERGTLGALGEAGTPLPFSLTTTLETGGRVEVTGDLERDPLRTRADVGLSELELAPLSNVVGAPIKLASGRATARVSLEVVTEGVSGSGTVTVEDLKTESPDPARPEDVIAWKTLQLDIRHFQSVPPGADLERLALDWPYVLVDRNPERIFPLSLVAGPPTTDQATAAASPMSTVNLRSDRVEVHGGRIDFRDTTLSPPYWRSLARLEVSANPAALPPVRVPRLRADGLVDELSPLHVEGTIGSTKTHLRADVKEVALTPFNVYLEPVSQYSVSSGTLTLHSEITLERAQLDVDNRIVLSRFGLGGSAEEDFLQRELGIPLTLAVALMKDYRGNIELACPSAAT